MRTIETIQFIKSIVFKREIAEEHRKITPSEYILTDLGITLIDEKRETWIPIHAIVSITYAREKDLQTTLEKVLKEPIKPSKKGKLEPQN